MIDLQKLVIGMATQALGGGLRSATRSSSGRSSRSYGRSGINEGKLLVGILGVAVAAYEHYTRSRAESGAISSSGSVPQPGETRPARAPAPPPPPPPSRSSTEMRGPPPIPGSTNTRTAMDPHALLLLRAMVASAYSDGALDEEERRSILEQLGGHSLSQDEKAFLESELSSPRSIQELAGAVSSFEEGKQVYAAAALAVQVDSDEELDFLSRLSLALEIDENTRREIDSQLGVSGRQQ